MNVTPSLRPRIEPSSTTALLAVGDLVAIGAFVVAGELSHGYHPIMDAGRVGGTLVPFLVGWAVVSVAGGLYTKTAIAGVRNAAVWTIPAWIVAVVIAQMLRATRVFHGDAALTFALVSVAIGGGLLVVWRVIVSFAANANDTQFEA